MYKEKRMRCTGHVLQKEQGSLLQNMGSGKTNGWTQPGRPSTDGGIKSKSLFECLGCNTIFRITMFFRKSCLLIVPI